MRENDLSAMERTEYLQLELDETEKQIHRCRRFIGYLEKNHKRQFMRLVASFFCIFICYGVFWVTDSENIIIFVSMIELHFLSEAAFLFFLLIRFPYNLLRYIGECGMDGLAEAFIGNAERSYANMKQKTIIELTQLEARRDGIYEQFHQGEETVS